MTTPAKVTPLVRTPQSVKSQIEEIEDECERELTSFEAAVAKFRAETDTMRSELARGRR